MAGERFNDETRRRELAVFLRRKRERLVPPGGAFPPQQRRLTPGLRREEIAELAGVGVTWYTWLEQARDIRPSERTFRRIAHALQLSRTETKYLLDLGLERAPRRASDERVPREVQSLVKGMSSPAFVLGRTSDLLFYNVAANALFDFDYVPERNYYRTFFSPAARAFVVHWLEYARDMVRVFRTRSAGMLGDPAVAAFIDDLARQSPEFQAFWAEQSVSDDLHFFRFVCEHPFVGHMEFDVVCFSVLERPDLVIVNLITEQHETRRRLDELMRQLESGEHDAKHNLWLALESQQASLSETRDHHSDYQ